MKKLRKRANNSPEQSPLETYCDMEAKSESWRPYIPYKTNIVVEVSNRGNIRYKGEILYPIKMPDGYKVLLEDKKWFIHKLVAFAWLGIKNEDYKLVHRNGDRSDNRVENLEYVQKNQPSEADERLTGPDLDDLYSYPF